MKRGWLLWLLVIAFIWIVVTRFAEIRGLIGTLAGGHWQLVLIAALLQIAYYVAYAWSYQAAFETAGAKTHLREVILITFASIFVNTLAPAGGAAGMALFMDDAARRGESVGRIGAGLFLQMVAFSAVFTLIIIGGLILMGRAGALQAYHVLVAVIFVVASAAQGAVLVLGLWKPDTLRRVLKWIEHTVNRIGAVVRKPSLIRAGWAAQTTAQFNDAAGDITHNIGGMLRVALIAGSAHLLNMISFAVLFAAFDQTVDLSLVIAGYAMALLFWIIAITPSGVGVAEGVTALVLGTMGIEAGTATVISLAYRGLTFWLPFVIGFLVLRGVKSFRSRRDQPEDQTPVRDAGAHDQLVRDYLNQ